MNELSLNADMFNELTENELNIVDGGIDWNSIGIGTSMAAGGLIGAKIGTAGGAPGIAAGTIIGGIAGGIIYSIWD